MLSVLFIGAFVAASALAARRWGLIIPPHTPRDQVDAFTRAREVTNTWSVDPESTPAPLREYLARQRQPRTTKDSPPQ